MSERVTGYILLAVGICVMLFALVNIYLVFTSKIQPITLFDTKGISFDINSLLPQLPKGASLNKGNQGLELIPSGTINQMLNVSTHFFLMSFVMTFGYKLASLGVMLVRPVVVKLKAKELTGSPQIS